MLNNKLDRNKFLFLITFIIIGSIPVFYLFHKTTQDFGDHIIDLKNLRDSTISVRTFEIDRGIVLINNSVFINVTEWIQAEENIKKI